MTKIERITLEGETTRIMDMLIEDVVMETNPEDDGYADVEPTDEEVAELCFDD